MALVVNYQSNMQLPLQPILDTKPHGGNTIIWNSFSILQNRTWQVGHALMFTLFHYYEMVVLVPGQSILTSKGYSDSSQSETFSNSINLKWNEIPDSDSDSRTGTPDCGSDSESGLFLYSWFGFQQKWFDSGIDSDSGIGNMHHCLTPLNRIALGIPYNVAVDLQTIETGRVSCSCPWTAQCSLCQPVLSADLRRCYRGLQPLQITVH